MSGRPANDRELELLRGAVARLRAGILAIVFALVSGSALLVATLWLVIRGGPDVGRHLGLLRNYFPGYTVTWIGSLVGFLYAAALGALLGYATAWIYNRVADRRLAGRSRRSAGR